MKALAPAIGGGRPASSLRLVPRAISYPLRMTENRTYSHAKAAEVLGYRPAYTTPLAIQEVAGWYRQQGILPALPLPPIFLALVVVLLLARSVCKCARARRALAAQQGEKKEQ